ncbi:hypothetical protein ACP70R_010258 [Stipagrostis hirtigluma subsp. patula]
MGHRDEKRKSRVESTRSNLPRGEDDPERRGQGGTSRKEESDSSKRPWQGRCSGRAAKRPAGQRQQHLYLAVDDWERGYSVYRLSEDDFHSGDVDADADVDVDLEARPAASPVIFAMRPSESSPGIPVFDTETLGVTVCPRPRSRGLAGNRTPVYASAGGRLLAFEYFFSDVLGPEPPPTKRPWSWTRPDALAPFPASLIRCHAVHPDGRTVFISVRGWRPTAAGAETLDSTRGKRESTFALDIASLEWTYVGEWLLPFKGQAHYDRELDAWVGLCAGEERAGRVCCCDVLPAAGGRRDDMPAWKLGKDVFFEFYDTCHFGATLVYMGGSRFCMVEKRAAKDEDSYPRHRVLKMTSFVLKYDKLGDLRTTQHRDHASLSYQIAHEQFEVVPEPAAFWM